MNVLEEPAVSIFKIKKVGQAWKLVYNIGKGGWNKAISKPMGATDTENVYLPEDGIKARRERVRG
jgi:hypothetical protein